MTMLFLRLQEPESADDYSAHKGEQQLNPVPTFVFKLVCDNFGASHVDKGSG
jgi:hypothetical protein